MEDKKNLDLIKEYNISFVASGGNASKNAKGVRLSLNKKWINDMGITESNRTVIATYNPGKKEIIIKPKDLSNDDEFIIKNEDTVEYKIK